MRLVKFVTFIFIYLFHFIQGGYSFFCSCSVVKFPNIPPVLRQISSNTSFLFMNPLHATLNKHIFTIILFFCPLFPLFPSSQVETQAAVQTFASPTFSSFLDMLLCCLVFLALSLACFLQPLVTQQNPSTPALILTAVATILEVLALLIAIR